MDSATAADHKQVPGLRHERHVPSGEIAGGLPMHSMSQLAAFAQSTKQSDPASHTTRHIWAPWQFTSQLAPLLHVSSTPQDSSWSLPLTRHAPPLHRAWVARCASHRSQAELAGHEQVAREQLTQQLGPWQVQEPAMQGLRPAGPGAQAAGPGPGGMGAPTPAPGGDEASPPIPPLPPPCPPGMPPAPPSGGGPCPPAVAPATPGGIGACCPAPVPAVPWPGGVCLPAPDCPAPGSGAARPPAATPD
ncbi:MAG: hypothetical protein MJD61_04285 [Proteobacteria bacterium]|nr:hypothetical protein [Pseudomonadota bacterium]